MSDLVRICCEPLEQEIAHLSSRVEQLESVVKAAKRYFEADANAVEPSTTFEVHEKEWEEYQGWRAQADHEREIFYAALKALDGKK